MSMKLTAEREATILHWVEKIYLKCEEHGIYCGIYAMQANGWVKTFEEFDFGDVRKAGVEKCDINIQGLHEGGGE
jgi:hypothetical protein